MEIHMKTTESRLFSVKVCSVVLFLLAGCGPVVKNPVPVGRPGTIAPYPAQEYTINYGDQLDVKFFYNSELNEQIIVRPDGRIALQLIGEVSVVGLTPQQLTDLLKEKYSQELAKCELTVIVRNFGGNKVFVDGEVTSPGLQDIVGPMTLRQAIAKAGGVTKTARTNEIVVIRAASGTKPVVMTADINKVNDGTDMSQDFLVAPHDIVYVPRSPIANLNLWVEQYIKNMTPVPIAIPIL